MGTHGWAYRRRQPEGTVLYEAVRDNLATLLAKASSDFHGEKVAPGRHLGTASMAPELFAKLRARAH